MLITFTHEPGPHSGGDEFTVGQTVDLPEPSAYRWISRGVAQAAQAETAAQAAPKPRRGRPPKAKAPAKDVTDGPDADSSA
jgi:hypothetical protein